MAKPQLGHGAMPESPRVDVEVRDLAKRYGQTEAVRGVSFTAISGQVLGLLGRNGAGKTSTLECVLGLRRPDAGAVTIGGIDALAEPERAKALVGAQLQAATLQEKLTPRQALRHFGSFYHDAAPAEALLEQFALTAKADAPFESLSGGQKQRLFLALALVHRPRVVVLDEPTAGLDPQARRELHAIITRARDAGVAVVLSTHDLQEAEHLCDRIGILHEGRLIALGAPAELLARTRAESRLVFQTGNPVDPVALAGLAGVAAVIGTTTAPGRAGASTIVTCSDVNAAIVSLGQHFGATANALRDLRIERPTLEQVFIELTGSAWDGEGDR